MKIFAYLFSIFIFISLQAEAQEQLPVKQGVFVSPDKKLYVNKNLGVYVWVSSSPDANSPKVRLMSDSSGKYSNPMYFDTEGYNTFRSPSAVDTTSRKTIYPLEDIIFEVYSDGIPPVTKLKFSKSPGFTQNNNVYYGKGLQLGFTAHDANSGVAGIYYSLSGENFIEFKDSLVFDTEGEKNIKFYSADHVGNRELVQSKSFVIDLTPPAVSFEVEGKTDSQAASSKAKIKLKAEDALSGVKAIYYRSESNIKQQYTGPIPFKVLDKEGSSLTFWAEDNVGNSSAVKSISRNDIVK